MFIACVIWLLLAYCKCQDVIVETEKSKEIQADWGSDYLCQPCVDFFSVRTKPKPAAPKSQGFFIFGVYNYTEINSAGNQCCPIAYQCTTAQKADACAYKVIRTLPSDNQITNTRTESANRTFITFSTNEAFFPKLPRPANPNLKWTYWFEERGNGSKDNSILFAKITVEGWTFEPSSRGLAVFFKIGTNNMQLADVELNSVPGSLNPISTVDGTIKSGFQSVSLLTLAKELSAEVTFPPTCLSDSANKSIVNIIGPFKTYTSYQRFIKIEFPKFTTSMEYTISLRLRALGEFVPPPGAQGYGSSAETSSENTLIVILVVLGCIVVCIIAGIVLCCCVFKNKKQKANTSTKKRINNKKYS